MLDLSGFATSGVGREPKQSRTVYKKQRTMVMERSGMKATKSQKKLRKVGNLCYQDSLSTAKPTLQSEAEKVCMQSAETKKTPNK